MKLLFIIVFFMPSLLFAASEDQIISVKDFGDTVCYVFAHKKVVVDLSGIPGADRDYIRKTFWSVDESAGKNTQIKICSRDSTEHAAMLGKLKAFGIVPVEISIELTVQQKADVIAGQIRDKGKIVKYLKSCAQLRAAGTITDSVTVRAVAKGGL